MSSIVEYIAEDSSEGATKVLEIVLESAESLSQLSHRGRMVPEIGDRSIREIFVYSYRLIYRVTPTEVQILALLHGAQDFGRWAQRQGLSRPY